MQDGKQETRSQDLAQTVVLQEPPMPLVVIMQVSQEWNIIIIFQSEKGSPMPAIPGL